MCYVQLIIQVVLKSNDEETKTVKCVEHMSGFATSNKVRSRKYCNIESDFNVQTSY